MSKAFKSNDWRRGEKRSSRRGRTPTPTEMPTGEEIKLIQKLMNVMAPEVEESKWAKVQPLGVRWLTRSAVTQLQSAVAWNSLMVDDVANQQHYSSFSRNNRRRYSNGPDSRNKY